MTYVNERVLIVAAHAWQCPTCRGKLLADPDGVLMRQGLSGEERKLFSQIALSDWVTVGALAKALGADRSGRQVRDSVRRALACRMP